MTLPLLLSARAWLGVVLAPAAWLHLSRNAGLVAALFFALASALLLLPLLGVVPATGYLEALMARPATPATVALAHLQSRAGLGALVSIAGLILGLIWAGIARLTSTPHRSDAP